MTNDTFFGAVVRDLLVVGLVAGLGAALAAVPVLTLGVLASADDAVNASGALFFYGALVAVGSAATLRMRALVAQRTSALVEVSR
jgi:hypothetical protein